MKAICITFFVLAFSVSAFAQQNQEKPSIAPNSKSTTVATDKQTLAPKQELKTADKEATNNPPKHNVIPKIAATGRGDDK